MSETDDSVTTRWDGYSDYQSVSDRIEQSIHDAIEGFATVERAQHENASWHPNEAARCGARILTAAINVQTELYAYADDNDEYAELLEKFEGDDGYVQKLREVRLRNESPGWLYEFVIDIRTAGFKLGYLKAGREEEENTGDTPGDQAQEMFADL